MELKTIIEMSLIELIPTLPFLIYIIITQRRNFKRLLKVEEKVNESAVASSKAILWADKKPPYPEVIIIDIFRLISVEIIFKFNITQ